MAVAVASLEAGGDADDVMLRAERNLWRSMVGQGCTLDEVRTLRRQQKAREKAKMLAIMEKYTPDPHEAAQIAVRLSLVYLGLENDMAFLAAVRRAIAKAPEDARIQMVCAKLLYRKGQMQESVDVCRDLAELKAEAEDEQGRRDLGDAYYILGWGEMQRGDHSGAYRVWAGGRDKVPDDARLNRQVAKRALWDEPWRDEELISVTGLLGAGAAIPAGASAADVAEAFEVTPGLSEPALGLFDADSQRRQLVFRSRQPLLAESECAAVVEHCEAFARARGGWGTVRHSTVRTTDVAVEDIPALRPWLRGFMATRLAPFLATCYPRLGDGSELRPERVRIHDAFIVRYDADKDLSLSLPSHADISTLSFTVALNDGDSEGDSSDACFAGGGTWFKALGGRVLDAPSGHAVSFAGPLRHAGHPVTKGTRIILVLFLYVEGFVYGELLKAAGGIIKTKSAVQGERRDDEEACADDGPLQHPDPGGFVVYNETKELVEALDFAADSEDEDDDEDEVFAGLL